MVCLSPVATPEAIHTSPAEIIHTSPAEMTAYGQSLWNGDEPETVTYRYGHTMRCRYGDQIATTLDILRHQHKSYRTLISL